MDRLIPDWDPDFQNGENNLNWPLVPKLWKGLIQISRKYNCYFGSAFFNNKALHAIIGIIPNQI